MSKVKISLPDQTENEIRRLVEQGEFLNRDQAIEELLSMGISAYETTEETPPEMDEEVFTQRANEQQDPALQDDIGDEDYTF